jgi:hypothetical protein
MAFGNTTGSPSVYISQDSADAILKDVYSPEGIVDVIFDHNPFLALIPKMETAGGRFFDQPLHVSPGQGGSSTFLNAQSAAATSGEGLYSWQVAKVENHAVATVDTKTVEESSLGTKTAFVDMVKGIADWQLKAMANVTSLRLYRGADMNIGIVAGSVAGTTLTFSNVADATSFEKGMWLDFASSNSGTSTTFASVTALYCQITQIDYIGGVATVSFSSGTNTLTAQGVSVGNYVYRSGDKSLGFNGFTDYIPYGPLASNDSFQGINRNDNRVRLAGSYLDGTSGSLEQTLMQAEQLVNKFGGELTHFLMPPVKYKELAQSQGSKVQYVDVVERPTIGFRGIEVVGNSGGPIVCLPDRSCPANLIAGVNMKSWKLLSVGPIVKTWQLDGRIWLRSSTASGMEIRFYSLGNLVCTDPVNNINIKVNPTA